jgi:photosystem II stability/assembly factor-like uncharacterized protein
VSGQNNDVFAGTNKGIYYSSDNGKTWIEKNAGLKYRNVMALAHSAGNTFAGTGNGLFMSSDNGNTWISKNLDISLRSVYSIGDSVLLAGSSTGIHRSTDQGSSWTQSYTGQARVLAIVQKDTLLIAGTEGQGILLSTDAGNTWTPSNIGFTDLGIYSLAVKENTLFAGLRTGIFISTDNGSTWTPAGNGPSANIRAIAVQDSIILAGTEGAGIYESTNNGNTWSPRGLSGQYVLAITLSGNTILASVGNKGVYQSTNRGSSWNSTSVPGAEIRAINGNGQDIYAGTDAGVYLSKNQGNSWTGLDNGLDGLGILCIAIDNEQIYAGTLLGGIFISTDKGSTWNSANSGIDNLWITSCTVVGSTVFIGTWGNGIYKSTDKGNSWTLSNNGLTTLYVQSFLYKDSILFTGTWLGSNYTGEGIYKSTDNGNSWTVVNNGLSNLDIRSLAMDTAFIYAGSYYGMRRSSNNGQLWSEINAGITNGDIRSIAVNQGAVFAASWGGGIYFSSDHGSTWRAANIGLSNLYVHSLYIQDSNIYAGTEKSELFKAEINSFFEKLKINTTISALNQSICAGSDVNLAISTKNARGIVSWQWRRADGSTIPATEILAGGSQQDSLIRLRPTATTQYKVIVQDASMAQDSISFTITVIELPIPTITGPTAICANQSGIRYSTQPANDILYRWKIQGGTATIQGDSTAADVLLDFGAIQDTVLLRLTQINASGCAKDTIYTIKVDSLLRPVIITQNNKLEYCSGSGLEMDAGVNAGTYQWKKDGKNINGSNSKTYTVIEPGIYSVEIRQNECSSVSPNITIRENPLPVPFIIGERNICIGQSDQVYRTGIRDTNSVYQWSILNGTTLIKSSTTTDSIILGFNITGTVTLRLLETNRAGCTKDTTLTILIGDSLRPQISSLQNKFSFCAGDSITLDAGISGAIYQWKKNGVEITGANAQQLYVREPGIYAVYVQAASGCKGESGPQLIDIITIPTPVIIQEGISLKTEIADSYQWLDSTGQGISGANEQSFQPLFSGRYSVRINRGGCSAASAEYFFQSIAPGRVIVLDYNFGNQVISSILNARGGHRGSLMIINKTGAKIVADSLVLQDKTNIFGIIPAQFPREIEAGDTSEIAISFSPTQIASFESVLHLYYTGGQIARGILQGTGRKLEEGSTITEIILKPNLRELYPGDTLQVCLAMGIQEPSRTEAREFQAVIDYDRRILEFLADDNVTPRKSPDKRDRRLLEIQGRRQENQSLLGCIRFIAKQAEADFTSILFNGGSKSFVWADGEGRVYPAYSDSLVRIKLCAEGGTQFVTRAPRKTKIIAVKQMGRMISTEYFQKAGDIAQFKICDLFGNIHKSQQLYSGSADIQGSIESELPGNGVYLLILHGNTGSSADKIIIAE